LDRLFYFPSEGRHAEDFFTSEKIKRLLSGSNPRTQEPEATEAVELLLVYEKLGQLPLLTV
jgi:hypothetical protein